MMSQILAKRNNMLKNPGQGNPPPSNPPKANNPPPRDQPKAQVNPGSRPGSTLKHPNPANNPPPLKVKDNATPAQSTTGGFSQEDLETLKKEILEEVKTQLNNMKEEILAALQGQT